MSIGEVLNVYNGDNSPKLKITCIKKFINVLDLIDHIKNIQDIYYLEFQISETITLNLKIESSCKNTPILIVEFDEINNIYYLWKSSGNWDMSTVISSFYTNHIVNDRKNSNDTLLYFVNSKEYQSHFNKKNLLKFIEKIDFNWDEEIVIKFWETFNYFLNKEGITTKVGSNENESVYNSLIILSILKIKLLQNQLLMKHKIIKYSQKMTNLNSNSNSKSKPNTKSNTKTKTKKMPDSNSSSGIDPSTSLNEKCISKTKTIKNNNLVENIYQNLSKLDNEFRHKKIDNI
ncbi:hypothetical protein Kpol_1016p28 [Vanderwaltozyma polyspora DSM 70294]|uniref:Uncharacterized protein n=1 Tax=Vanderwaltozyma polyspora (strain ATCC 22028 / DSM 70294 / BCRC 21397 / CBS 2163 / NBRC 10782 / NRRL Y-8283 / UCD 57-17) TaxID=436907 RepID=A7TNU2_VANPO|nr:uncharacterized protein Kpol_1016p28 [Vanderwaltozyma polyspora DSM 70294]EDO16085.1 hypothetical protein Kpol_1016p28 [Vanderwaltozyma polyspora DSM 70294]